MVVNISLIEYCSVFRLSYNFELEKILRFLLWHYFQQVNISGENMIFYVDNHKTAQCLSLSDLKIQMKDGWKVKL